MEPHIFREQLKRAFNIQLSPGELAVVVSHYDKKATGVVNCQEFLRVFLRQGIKIREENTNRWRKLQRANEEAAKKAAKEKLEMVVSRKFLSLGPYSQSDFDIAMKKLVTGATQYHKSPSDVLDAFEAKRLP